MNRRSTILALALLVLFARGASARQPEERFEAAVDSTALPRIPVALVESAPDSLPASPTLEPLRNQFRSARTAVAMTFVVPGWGQLYGDSPFWSVVAFGTQMYYLGNVLLESRRGARQETRRDLAGVDSPEWEVRDLLVTEHRERVRDFIWWGAAGYLIIGLDAFVTVQLFGFDAPVPATPDLDRDWGGEAPSGEALGLGLTFDF